MSREVKKGIVDVAVARIVQIIVEEIDHPIDRKTQSLIEEAVRRLFDLSRPVPKPMFWVAVSTSLAIALRTFSGYVTLPFLAKLRERINGDSLLSEYLDSFWNFGDDGDTDPESN